MLRVRGGVERLVRGYVVNGAVGGQQCSDSSAAYASNDRADSCGKGFAADIDAEGLVAAPFVGGGTDRSSYTGTRGSYQEGVAQTMFVFHQLHCADVLLLNALFGCSLREGDGCFGDAREGPGMFLRGSVDDLNLLAGMQHVEICPGGLIELCARDARQTKETDQEQDLSHRCSVFFYCAGQHTPDSLVWAVFIFPVKKLTAA